MRVTFAIKESLQELLTQLESLIGSPKNIYVKEENSSQEHLRRFCIVDEDYPSSNATVSVHIDKFNDHAIDMIHVKTAMSGFAYVFKTVTATGQPVCTYDGALRGFMQQNLMLRFTPIITGGEIVSTRLAIGVLFKDYIFEQYKRKVVEALLKSGNDIYSYPNHPNRIASLEYYNIPDGLKDFIPTVYTELIKSVSPEDAEIISAFANRIPINPHVTEDLKRLVAIKLDKMLNDRDTWLCINQSNLAESLKAVLDTAFKARDIELLKRLNKFIS